MNDSEVLETVSAALNDYNSKTTESYLRLLEIGRAKIQVISTAMSSLSCKHNISSILILHCYLVMFANRDNLLALIRPPDLLLISQLLCVILATGIPFTPVGDEATTFAFYLFSAALQFECKVSQTFFLFYQYHPGHVVVTEFAVGATNCSAQEAKANVGACQLLPEDQSVSMAAHQPQLPSSEVEKQHHAGMCLHWSRNRPLWGSKCKRRVPSWYVFQYIILKAISHLSLFSKVSGLNSHGFEYIWKRLEDQRQNIFNEYTIYYCLFLKWAPEKIKLFVLDSTQSN